MFVLHSALDSRTVVPDGKNILSHYKLGSFLQYVSQLVNTAPATPGQLFNLSFTKGLMPRCPGYIEENSDQLDSTLSMGL